MGKYDLVLFDFDGTLYNTFLGIARSYQHALREVASIEVENLDEFRRCVGPPLLGSFIDFYNLSPDNAAKAVEVFRGRYGVTGVLECEPYEGALEMLKRIKAAGIKVAISSSKPEEMINKILGADGLIEEFDLIVGIKNEQDKATKTDAINEAIAHFNIDKSKIAMVGDRYYDAEGAQNVGVDFIAAMYGFGTTLEMQPFPNVFMANDTNKVADFVLR